MPVLDVQGWDVKPQSDSGSDAETISKQSLTGSETTTELEKVVQVTTQIPTDVLSLPPDHRQYLLDRHGTLDLDPVPAFGDADPYNWPTWKKILNLIQVGILAMLGTLTGGVIIPAFSAMAEDLNVTLQQASYLVSLQIAILGGAPLFWKPISNRYGRRPIFLLSIIGSLVANVGCAKSPTYATMAVCRAIGAFFISPAGAIGSSVVAESFFKHQRARYMGVWTVLVTSGIPVGPLAFGFVTTKLGYRWIYWILAMVNAVQFILYLFFGPETRYIRKGVSHERSTIKQEYLNIFRYPIDPKPIRAIEFIQPLFLARYPYIFIPSVVYAMSFLWGVVLTTIEVPQLFEKKFNLDAEQLGLQFIASIIGGVLGEQVGGLGSDLWMTRRRRRRRHQPESQVTTIARAVAPEFRLWLSYLGLTCSIIGPIVFLVQTQLAKQGHWNVTPLVGTAMGACGNQIITTVLFTYAVDCLGKDEAGSVGVYVTFVRQTWAFIGPFWLPELFETVGVAASSGVAVAMLFGVGVLPTILLHWKGAKWRATN